MNPVIITPEIYDIFETKIEDGISYRQRHNLASVAKILQYASNKKGVRTINLIFFFFFYVTLNYVIICSTKMKFI